MTRRERTYGAASEADIPAMARLLHHAFASTQEGSDRWIKQVGLGEFRVVREEEGAEAKACLVRIPMGQFFGGKSVGMLGIAGVAVAPETRGKGAARWIMERALGEARSVGIPLSALYASTQALYRSVGYEQAGYRHVTRLAPHRIGVGTRDLRVRPLADADDEAVKACYRGYASRFNGTLDRGRYCWDRVRNLRDQKYTGFGVEAVDGGGLDGYVFIMQSRDAVTMEGQVQVSDLAFRSGAAGRRLLGFLADFATTTGSATLGGAPLLPLLSLMDSHRAGTDKGDVWMLRVVDVGRALEARGYSRHVSARVCIDVRDELFEENSGVWTVEVDGGACRAAKKAGAFPTMKCSINALAALYSGLYCASQAAVLGWVEGPEHALHAADAMFGGGGVPWMTDFF